MNIIQMQDMDECTTVGDNAYVTLALKKHNKNEELLAKFCGLCSQYSDCFILKIWISATLRSLWRFQSFHWSGWCISLFDCWKCWIFKNATRGRILVEIQTKVFRVFLLAFHIVLCSFAFRFIILQTRATSYSFYTSVTVHCKGERRKTW